MPGDQMTLASSRVRRWSQFRLWHLLALVTVAAIPFAVLTNGRERFAVAYLVVPRMLPAASSLGAYSWIEFRNAQFELVTSSSVLGQAARDPAVAEIWQVVDEPDAARWLRSHVQVDFPNNAEIMRVRLDGLSRVDRAVILKAVVDTYLAAAGPDAVASGAAPARVKLLGIVD
jgi:hypothetical protein